MKCSFVRDFLFCWYCSSCFFSSRRRHTSLQGDWSSDVCSSDLPVPLRDHAHADLISQLLVSDFRNLEPLDWWQIGRASCRESAESWAGAGPEEKKSKDVRVVRL